MKTNSRSDKRVKKLIAVLVCFIAVLLPQKSFSQTGTSCANAINLRTGDTCFSATSSGTTFWYKFTADTSALHINLNNMYGNDSIITQMILYSGTCSSLTGIDTSLFDPLASLILNAEDLTVGTIYYLKLFQPNGNPANYNFCLKGGYTDIAFCAGCPSSLYNSASYCELVCNGDFEYYTAPPTDLAQITNACPWYRSNGTSDYFNTNHTNGPQGTNPGVPANSAGSQSSCQGGQGYAGFFTYIDPAYPNVGPNFREYVIQKLISPMIAGKTYNVTFNVSLADYCGFASKNVGFWITSFSPSQIGNTSLNVTPTFSSSGYITDANNWVPFTYQYTATGGEQWITFGQFTNNIAGSATPVTPNLTPPANSAMPHSAYYYLDKVSIVPANVTSVTAAPGGVCPGESISLSAIVPSGTTGNTYAWTPSLQVSPTNTQNTTGFPSGSGTWFVCHTDAGYGGCVEADSVFVNVSPAAPPVNAGSDITICKGASATLTGTGTSNGYGWAVLNGPVLCSLCTTTTVTPTVTTSYVYHATNTHGGCSSYDTVKVIVNSIPNIHIVPPIGLASCDTNAFVFTTTPTGSYTYSWTTDASTYSGQTTSTLTATWGSSFSVDGNVHVTVTDGNGCISKDSIVVPKCCKSGSHGFTNTKTSANLSLFPLTSGYQQATGATFDIDGIFTVDMNTRFKGCTVNLGANAKIIIAAGIKLELDSSKFHSCGNMWDGIYVDGTNTTSEVRVIRKSVIEDAKNAIVSSHGGKFTIDGSAGLVRLNKNYIAVEVKPFTGTHPGTIKRAIISCDAPGQTGATTGITSAGPNCKAPMNTLSYIGVRIDTCTNVVIGDTALINNRNVFERMQIGIYSQVSVVKVQNNDFRYFTNTIYTHTPPNNLPLNGIGVYATNNLSSTSRTLTVGQPGTKKATNYFLKCSYGIVAYDFMGLSCQHNRLDSCSVIGIYALQDGGNRTILINKDTMVECRGTNISCVNVNNATVTITGNMINQTQNFTTTNFGTTGIMVQNAINTAHVNLTIQDNQVRKMRNGIWVSYVSGGKVFSNTVTILTGQNFSSQLPGTGIHLEKNYGTHVRQNTVSYAATPTSGLYDKLFGISVYDCKVDTITKNTLDSLGSGIFMKGADNPCVVACNTMKKCVIGINFGYTNAAITPLSLNSQLLWTSANTHTPTGCVWSGCTTDLRGGISNGPISWYYNTTNAPITWNFIPNSFVGNAPTSLGSAGDQCGSPMLLPPHQVDSTKRDQILSGICKNPRTYDTLSTEFLYDDKVFAYRILMENPTWTSLGTTDDSYYANFVAAQSTTNVGKLYTAESDIASGDFADAAANLTSITPSNRQEANYKSVMNVYLQSWALDSMNLTDDQKDTLRAIASQGALTGGSVVFDSRNMLNEEVHDSSNARIAYPEGTMQGEASVSYIYPNPTTGQISINISLPQDQNGTLELFDLTGRHLITWQLMSGQTDYTFDASFLPSGTYIYRIAEGTEVLRTDRLIIIKE